MIVIYLKNNVINLTKYYIVILARYLSENEMLQMLFYVIRFPQ